MPPPEHNAFYHVFMWKDGPSVGNGADGEGYGLNSFFVYMSKNWSTVTILTQSFCYYCDENCVQLTSLPALLPFLSFLCVSAVEKETCSV